jgi:hypothetical protein
MVGKTWPKHETMFPNIVVLAHPILRNIKSQIEAIRIFFFNGDTYKVEKMSFTIKKFKRLIFMNKNKPNDDRIDC